MSAIKRFYFYAACFLALSACTNDKSFLIDSTPESEFVNPMSFIGDIHNQGLDAISFNLVGMDSVN